jgi:hypothetical protein
VFQFTFHIGIPERGITFAAAPENVTLSTEFMSYFHGFLHLCGGVGEYAGIWAGGCSMREPRMGKKTGGGPKQLDARALLLFFEHIDDGAQIAVGLCQISTFRCDISIMKGVERCAQFLDKFERDMRAIACIFNGGRAVVPRADSCTDTKRITQNVPEAVPVCHRKAQMVGHRSALDDFSSIVVFESQGVFGRWPFVRDFSDFRKRGFHK